MREALVKASGHSENDEIQPEQETEQALTEEQVNAYAARFLKLKNYYESRMERIDALMKRRSAKRWDSKKKQKMVRRLISASQTAKQYQAMIEQIEVAKQQQTPK